MDISCSPHFASSASSVSRDSHSKDETWDHILVEGVPLGRLPYLAKLWGPKWKEDIVTKDKYGKKIMWKLSDFLDGEMARKIGEYMMQTGSVDDLEEMKHREIDPKDTFTSDEYEEPRGTIAGRPKFYHFSTGVYWGGFVFVLKKIVLHFHRELWTQRYLLSKENGETWNLLKSREFQ